ncbi:hypothetical protein FRB90_012789 [Tulasnella sp. 427]|nr:hypothetical protein FRB90_012789 [Tulasnella sp. 427]
MSSDAQTTLSTSTSSPSPSSRHHPHSPSSSSTSSHSHSHLQPSHHPHSSNSSSRLALSRSFFRSVSDVSKSAFAYSSSSSSASTSTHSTETCSSAMSSTSTVHLAVERRPSDGSLINDGLAVNENGKARHEALPRAPSPSQLDPHPRPHPHAHGNSSSRANPRASSPLLAPPPLPLPQLPHSEHARGSNDGHPTSLSVNVNSNFDTYDPFAAHYAPPTQPNSRKRLSPPTTSAVVPAPTTTNVVDRESPTRLLPPLPKIVGNVKQVSRPRALSLGPPPNRPLPPAPAPVQPLNIRRRPRAQTVGTTSPIIPVEPTTTASLAAFTATVSQPVVGLGMGVLPISPPATASSRLDFDSILDVVVTPAAESVDVYGGMLVDDDSKTASRPTTPATISSLPYLRGSESTNMLSLHAGARHSRGSSLSGSEWDGCSRTVSEMSLSLFPAPPARSIPATEPPVAASSSLLPPPSSLTSVLELPTPPVTPTNPRFVPNAPGPYSTSVASRSTSTIRPSKLEEGGDQDSCVLPLEDQSRLDYNTPATRPPSEATAPSVRYSADSSCSEPGFPSSATTVSSHETSVEDSVCPTSLDTDQTSEMMHIVDSPPRSSRSSVQQQQKRKAGAGSSVSKSNTLWCPPSPPQADRHSTQGKDKFNLLPNFYFDATFTASHHAPPSPPSALPGQPPSTPIKHRKSGVARREQLLNLLSANESAAQLRSPGSPWGGRVEWGEAL